MGAWLLLVAWLAADADATVAEARAHFAQGRYAEAEETLAPVLKADEVPVAATILQAELDGTQGRYDAAQQVLSAAIEKHPKNANLQARSAKLALFRGRLTEALSAAEAALKLNPDEPLAHLVQADVWTELGDLRRAGDGYRWFVRYYNRAQPTDAETLLLVAEGSAQYARWRSVSQIFSFVVNTLSEDALKADPKCWPAHHIAGALLLEKYNRADGLPELSKALAINPNAIDVRLTLAESALSEMQFDEAISQTDRVLEINPQHPVALRLKAEAKWQQGALDDAETLADKSLTVRPTDQASLALAAFLRCQRGELPTPDRLQELLSKLEQIDQFPAAKSRFETIVVDLARRNPRPGLFLSELGRLFKLQRQFPLAERCLQQAVVVMPQLAQPKSELGLLHFQAGRMDEARKLFDAAFESDPYHVRVSNMRKVLKVLDDYATIATPHFVIRVDSQLDSVLAKYMAEELEQVYADVTREYGFEPPQRTQIEVYNKAKGLAGHQWFSARMTGLPWLQTIGASTGLIVALTSPAATEEPYNWARVLRHEFVHVVTLQQTDFQIPHWFTEALATRAEGYPPPPEWNRLLRKRYAENKLRNLDNLHLGFQRAESREDWDMAYCQSVLYAEYFVERFGQQALPKLLEAYRHTRSTEVALQTAYGVEKADVERGYREFIDRRVKALGPELAEGDVVVAKSADDIEAAYAAEPFDLDAREAYAELRFRQKMFDEAGEVARSVLSEEPQRPRAALVMAQILLQAEANIEAAQVLQGAFNADKPHHELWARLALLKLQNGAAQQALDLYRQGVKAFPSDRRFQRGIAEAAQAVGDKAAWKEALEVIARTDPDDADARLNRAKLALDEQDFATAVKYAKLALQVDVLDVEIHRTLARGFRGLQDLPAAIAEYDVALQLKPDDVSLQVERGELKPVEK
jgi:cellulose synthase operon protein C